MTFDALLFIQVLPQSAQLCEKLLKKCTTWQFRRVGRYFPWVLYPFPTFHFIATNSVVCAYFNEDDVEKKVLARAYFSRDDEVISSSSQPNKGIAISTSAAQRTSDKNSLGIFSLIKLLCVTKCIRDIFCQVKKQIFIWQGKKKFNPLFIRKRASQIFLEMESDVIIAIYTLVKCCQPES